MIFLILVIHVFKSFFRVPRLLFDNKLKNKLLMCAALEKDHVYLIHHLPSAFHNAWHRT